MEGQGTTTECAWSCLRLVSSIHEATRTSTKILLVIFRVDSWIVLDFQGEGKCKSI
jgi:hypothetical protein